MPSTQKDQLLTLIQSLTKAEKRNFKLYANRSQSGVDSKFLQLFDVLDRLEEYDEEQILSKLPAVEKRHLSNLKRHLYKQILISLRLIHIQKNIDIQIREQLDFARILYGKGMYMQSLRILDRIKKIAVEHHQDLLHLEILEFQKMIEARHITRSRTVENKMEDLLAESSRRSSVTDSTSRLSNLNIQIHGLYIEFGHIRSEADGIMVKEFFRDNAPEQTDKRGALTFFEKVNLYQANMWYYYILLEFGEARRWAEKWVNLYKEYPPMQEKDPDLYARGLYYLLTFNFFIRKKEEFAGILSRFEDFWSASEDQLNDNSQMIALAYLNLSRLNWHFMNRDMERGLQLVPAIHNYIRQYKDLIDEHRILLFYYKIAGFYFGCGDFDTAIEYLSKIINQKGGFLREDLYNNARLLHLICHYELGNYDLLSYLAPSIQRSFNKSNDVTRLQKYTLAFIKELIRLSPSEVMPAFQGFQKRLQKFRKSVYESKAFIYLYVPDWVESRLKGCSIQELYEGVVKGKGME